MTISIQRRREIAIMVVRMKSEHQANSKSLSQKLKDCFTDPDELCFAMHAATTKPPGVARASTVDATTIWSKAEDDSIGSYVPIELLKRSFDGGWEYWRVQTKNAELPRFLKLSKADNKLQLDVAKARVLAEYRELGRFSHENVVSVFDAGKIKIEGQEHFFIATEFINGLNLEEWRSKHDVSEVKAAKIVGVLAETLIDLRKKANEQAGHHDNSEAQSDRQPASANLLMHLDLKPRNVMVANSEDGDANKLTLRLIDFASSGTADNALGQGTRRYLAPERIGHRTGQIPNQTWDIFSLGAIVLYLITGNSPDPPDVSEFEQSEAKIHWDKWLRQLPIQNKYLLSICEKAMSYSPEDRFQCLDELFASLIAFSENRPVPFIDCHPSMFEKERMLYERLRTRVDRMDHDQLIARVSIAAATLLLFTTTCYVCVVAAGWNFRAAWHVVGYTNVLVLTVLMILAIWIGRGQLFSTAIFQPYATCAILTAVVSLFSLPLATEPASTVEINTMLYGVMMLSLGSAVPEWRILKYYSYFVLLLAIFIGRFFDNNVLTEYVTVPFWFAGSFGAVLHAWSIDRSVRLARAASERVESS